MTHFLYNNIVFVKIFLEKQQLQKKSLIEKFNCIRLSYLLFIFLIIHSLVNKNKYQSFYYPLLGHNIRDITVYVPDLFRSVSWTTSEEISTITSLYVRHQRLYVQDLIIQMFLQRSVTHFLHNNIVFVKTFLEKQQLFAKTIPYREVRLYLVLGDTFSSNI